MINFTYFLTFANQKNAYIVSFLNLSNNHKSD